MKFGIKEHLYRWRSLVVVRCRKLSIIKMIQITLSIFVLILCSVSSHKCGVPCPDYYWRDFTGTIPEDAFVAASPADGNCKTLYVGQVYFKKWELLPATIDSETSIATTTAYGKFLNASEYVKILCSPDNEIFEWIPIQSSELHLYLNRAIPGGSEVGQPLYIGRVRYKGKYIIGKVFKDDQSNKGLWIHNPGDSHANFVAYELLAYNCSKLRQGGCDTNGPDSE